MCLCLERDILQIYRHSTIWSTSDSDTDSLFLDEVDSGTDTDLDSLLVEEDSQGDNLFDNKVLETPCSEIQIPCEGLNPTSQ